MALRACYQYQSQNIFRGHLFSSIFVSFGERYGVEKGLWENNFNNNFKLNLYTNLLIINCFYYFIDWSVAIDIKF